MMNNNLNNGKITIKGIIFEDFVNYKKCSMTIAMPHCSFKCDKECGKPVCQNSKIANDPNITVSIDKIIRQYLNNPISHSIVFQGLEPMDSWEELKEFLFTLRIHNACLDDVVIYTGYNKDEIIDKIEEIRPLYSNIIFKYGRYIPDQEPHYDEILGVKLASDNQYAEIITLE